MTQYTLLCPDVVSPMVVIDWKSRERTHRSNALRVTFKVESFYDKMIDQWVNYQLTIIKVLNAATRESIAVKLMPIETQMALRHRCLAHHYRQHDPKSDKVISLSHYPV